MPDYKFVLYETLDDGRIVLNRPEARNAQNRWRNLRKITIGQAHGVNDDGFPVAKEGAGIPNWREAPPVVPAVKDKVRADQ